MRNNRPKVLLACNNEIRYNHVADQDLRRLEAFADWDVPLLWGRHLRYQYRPECRAPFLEKAAWPRRACRLLRRANTDC